MTTHRAKFRPQARRELRDAQAWYEEQVEGLGLEFAKAVDVALDTICEHPDSFAVVDAPYRQYVMRRFPFSIVYRIAEDRVVVVAVHHQRRQPRRWG